MGEEESGRPERRPKSEAPAAPSMAGQREPIGKEVAAPNWTIRREQIGGEVAATTSMTAQREQIGEEEAKDDTPQDAEETNQATEDPRVLLSGEIRVPAPEGEKAWAQCLRNMTRMLESGNVVVIGRQRSIVRKPCEGSGDLSREALDKAVEQLSHALAVELFAQNSGEERGSVKTASALAPAEQERLRQLTWRVAAHLTMNLGVQLMSKHDLKGLWQPTFAVCVVNGQVCVMTLAFVGEPVTGDRPCDRRTPFLLRLLTSDLSQGVEPATTSFVVRAVGESVKTTADYLASIDPALLVGDRSA